MQRLVYTSLFSLAVACTASTSSTETSGNQPEPSGGSPTVSGPACRERCGKKLSACGAPEAMGAQACASVCGSNPTESRLACLEGKSCEELESGDSLDALCPPEAKSQGNPPSSSGSTPTKALPAELTISGKFGSVKAIHLLSDDKKRLSSAWSAAPKPSFSPETAQYPDLSGAKYTVDSPAMGACKATLNWTLNGSQIGLTLSGQDLLPAADCAKFMDAIAEGGIQATFPSAAYSVPGDVRAKVKVSLTP